MKVLSFRDHGRSQRGRHQQPSQALWAQAPGAGTRQDARAEGGVRGRRCCSRRYTHQTRWPHRHRTSHLQENACPVRRCRRRSPCPGFLDASQWCLNPTRNRRRQGQMDPVWEREAHWEIRPPLTPRHLGVMQRGRPKITAGPWRSSSQNSLYFFSLSPPFLSLCQYEEGNLLQ